MKCLIFTAYNDTKYVIYHFISLKNIYMENILVVIQVSFSYKEMW